MVYLTTFTIQIHHSWMGKYTILPWIRHGYFFLDRDTSWTNIWSAWMREKNKTQRFPTKKTPHFHNPYDPWDWYIYLHEWLILMVNVGKYTSPMDPMGNAIPLSGF